MTFERLLFNRFLVLVAIGLMSVIGETSASDERTTADNCSTPKLTLVHSLDFGDLRVPRGAEGYVYIDPEGGVSHGNTVLMVRDPVPGEMLLCGRADQRVQIRLEESSVELTVAGGRPVARELQDITLAGSGTQLTRVGPGRWETRLPASGRARVTIGATLYLRGAGNHGVTGASLALEVEAL